MLAQQIVNGLTLGAVYTLVALSFSLVMGILSILNLAIGELFMLGGFIGFTVIAANFPLPVALLAGMAAGGVDRDRHRKNRMRAAARRAADHAASFDARFLDHPAERGHQYLGFRSAAIAVRIVR